MKAFMYFLLLLGFSTVSCQNNKGIESKKEKGKSIYLSSPMPYTVKGYIPNLALPDSLSIKGRGNAVLDIFIDEKGKPEGFNITFLKLVDSDLDTLRYYKYIDYPLKASEYPYGIQKFLAFFTQYVSGLEIVREENVPVTPNVKYLMKIPIKLE